ncbi:hypothetical protein CHARACLAT_025346 [Characodon lateralis]|uniref:Uncharacterized protein n=1 Tax=Characodon lateralis TaxID=208331 RepID=A0ABU7F5Y6_9TELE|nr:hypothetical protein [Characodon lateralis]
MTHRMATAVLHSIVLFCAFPLYFYYRATPKHKSFLSEQFSLVFIDPERFSEILVGSTSVAVGFTEDPQEGNTQARPSNYAIGDYMLRFHLSTWPMSTLR